MKGQSSRLLACAGQALLAGMPMLISWHLADAAAPVKGSAQPGHERWQQEMASAAMSGFWQGVMEPEDERFRRLGPSGGPNVGEFTGLHFTPEGLKKAQSWSPDDEYLPENLGKSQIVPTIMTTPFPIKFEFGRQQVTVRITECDNVRTVKLGAAADSADKGPGSAMGVSTGHWEGSTLVIRTTGVRAGQVRANGAPQSPNAVVTERYAVMGDYLAAILIIEDPMYYTQPVLRAIAYRKRNDLKALEQYGSCS